MAARLIVRMRLLNLDFEARQRLRSDARPRPQDREATEASFDV